MEKSNGLGKNERIASRKLIETLFGKSGSHSMARFPLRMVYMETDREDGDAPVQILTSVPKKRFRHAVDRNRVKRQLREAYRHNKQGLTERMKDTPERKMAVAFIWIANDHHGSDVVENAVKTLLDRLTEKRWAQ